MNDPASLEWTGARYRAGRERDGAVQRNAHGSEKESEEESGEKGKGSREEEVTEAHAVTISVAPLAGIVMARGRPSSSLVVTSRLCAGQQAHRSSIALVSECRHTWWHLVA
jgi:hypothetical protein